MRRATTLAVSFVVSVPAIARAEAPSSPPPSEATVTVPEKPRHRLKWEDEWPRFRILEYGTTVALYAELAFVNYRMKQPTTADWNSGFFTDDFFRNTFRLHDPGGRIAAGKASGYLTLFDQFDGAAQSVIVPILFDRGNIDVAWQLTMMNAEAGALEGLLVRSMNLWAPRGRPSRASCAQDKSYGDCGGEIASFPSGHSMAAFTGAGLTCAHHMNVPLYGGGVPDGLACALDLAVGTATASMRLLSDNHWSSDIFLGGMLGFGIGFGLPNLLHYRALVPEIKSKHGDLRLFVLPQVSSTDVGANAVGMF